MLDPPTEAHQKENVTEKEDLQEDMGDEVGKGDDNEEAMDEDKPAVPEKLFSSDDFKIEVQNLPKYFGMGQLKKLFNNNKN